MKARLVVVCSGLFALVASASDFQNLGFDDANTNGVQVGWAAPVSQLVPGWSVQGGSNTLPVVMLDGVELAWPITGDARVIEVSGMMGLPVIGKYALDLTPPLDQEMSVSQRGLIPPDTKSLWFTATSGASPAFDPPGYYQLTIDGQSIHLQWRPSGTEWVQTWDVGGDISTYAGKEVDLVFSTSHVSGRMIALDAYVLDAIRFSPEPIPELSVSLLLLVAFCIAAPGMRQTNWRYAK